MIVSYQPWNSFLFGAISASLAWWYMTGNSMIDHHKKSQDDDDDDDDDEEFVRDTAWMETNHSTPSSSHHLPFLYQSSSPSSSSSASINFLSSNPHPNQIGDSCPPPHHLSTVTDEPQQKINFQSAAKEGKKRHWNTKSNAQSQIQDHNYYYQPPKSPLENSTKNASSATSSLLFFWDLLQVTSKLSQSAHSHPMKRKRNIVRWKWESLRNNLQRKTVASSQKIWQEFLKCTSSSTNHNHNHHHSPNSYTYDSERKESSCFYSFEKGNPSIPIDPKKIGFDRQKKGKKITRKQEDGFRTQYQKNSWQQLHPQRQQQQQQYYSSDEDEDHSEEEQEQQEENPSFDFLSTALHPLEKSGLCIGSIFGLDVGGTLAKLVYFEKRSDESSIKSPISRPENIQMSRSEYFPSSTATFAVTRETKTNTKGTMDAQEWEDSLLQQSQLSLNTIGSQKQEYPGMNRRKMFYSTHIGSQDSHSEEDLKKLLRIRQTSLPDNFLTWDTTSTLHPTSSTSISEEDTQTLDDKTSCYDGIKKCRSMFDFAKSNERDVALSRFYEFARRLDLYESGVKEKDLSFFSRALGGDFHFLQFETRRMQAAMNLIRMSTLHRNILFVGATGGGAHRFSQEFESTLGIKMVKQDELDSMVAGMQYALKDSPNECYTFVPDEDAMINSGYLQSTVANPENSCALIDSEEKEKSEKCPHKSLRNPQVKSIEQYWWSKKVQRNITSKANSYPYLLVVIGTGVSLLRVDGPRKHERISGSTIGGGTYWGLCRLLTDVEDFQSVLALAKRGDASKVDMLVGDIYGPSSDALEKIGLSANIVASSFGKLVSKPDPAAGLKQEDLANALLLMVTNNIGQVAYLNAKLHNTKRIYFVGNFLRHNIISQQRLAYAINFWSQGKMEALFLEHEGYFGALGAFLLSQGSNSKMAAGHSHITGRSRHESNRSPPPLKVPTRRMRAISF